jgi:hypothetical protein
METPPQQIKLLSIDIDGTLLNPQRHITPRTRRAIQAAQEAGVVVTLATGRRYHNTAPIANELGIAIPLIICDGAVIMQHPQGQTLYTHPMTASTAQHAVNIMVQRQLQPIVHQINAQHVEETWTGPADFDNVHLGPYIATYPQNLHRMPHAMLCDGQPDPLRVVAFASEEEILALIPKIDTLDCAWDMVKRGNYYCSELAVMHPTCSKATGVQALAQQLHIDMEQVMALGDNTNDLAMLRAAGWGVAMGQATETIRAQAHAVTASNAEDGVAQAIERYILAATPKH